MSNLLNIKLKKLATLLKDRSLYGEACEVEKLASYEALEKARHIWKQVVPTPSQRVRHYVHDPTKGRTKPYPSGNVLHDAVKAIRRKYRVSFLWRDHRDPLKADLLHGFSDGYGSKPHQSVSNPSPTPPRGGAVREYWGDTETIVNELARMVNKWMEKHYNMPVKDKPPIPDTFLEEDQRDIPLTTFDNEKECRDNDGLWKTEINGKSLVNRDGSTGMCFPKDFPEEVESVVGGYDWGDSRPEGDTTPKSTSSEEEAKANAHKVLMKQVEEANERSRKAYARKRKRKKRQPINGVVEE